MLSVKAYLTPRPAVGPVKVAVSPGMKTWAPTMPGVVTLSFIRA